MLSDLRLARLIRAVETHVEREGDSTPRKSASRPLEKALAAPIVSYLLEPYEHGYWELRATWNPSAPFAKYLLEKLNTLTEIEKNSEPTFFSPTAVARKLTEDKRAELLRVSNRLSSINVLFQAAMRSAGGDNTGKFPERDAWVERLDLTQIPETFPAAWKVFTERIYFEGFQTSFMAPKPRQIKAGLVTLLEGPKTSGTIHFVAMGRDELSALSDFYLALGATTDSSIRRVFAPDEDLFRPYFPLVSSVLNHVIHDGQISRVFEQALAYYEEEDFQHCISSLGLIAEDYLQRIYTTLLREPLPGGLTLGQIVERLHKRIDELFPHQKLTQKSLDPLYEHIKLWDADADPEAIKQILREFISFILEDRQYNAKRVEELLRPPIRRSVVPPNITDRLNELLKWRNAASHNSRIPLGAQEADRTLFCLVSLITWWQAKLATMDWTMDRLKLVDQLLNDAKAK
jgi:hypothetical protein